MDKYDRKIGETDAELRQRVIDIPIAKKARAAIWRVFDMPNKDAEKVLTGAQAFLMIGGKKIAYVTNVSCSIMPIDVLGKYDPVEVVPTDE